MGIVIGIIAITGIHILLDDLSLIILVGLVVVRTTGVYRRVIIIRVGVIIARVRATIAWILVIIVWVGVIIAWILIIIALISWWWVITRVNAT